MTNNWDTQGILIFLVCLIVLGGFCFIFYFILITSYQTTNFCSYSYKMPNGIICDNEYTSLQVYHFSQCSDGKNLLILKLINFK